MTKRNISLTPTEWHLMECLWEKAPRTGREATEFLHKQVGWTRSTTLTLLRRLTEKGFVRCDAGDGVKIYSPLIQREGAVMRETEDFLSRVYKGSVSMMMSAVTKRQHLTQEEINELYGILRQAEEAKK